MADPDGQTSRTSKTEETPQELGGGMAFLDGKPVVVIGQQKGRGTKQTTKIPKPGRTVHLPEA
jgi:acetyl-CoA carboxylase alpha subunit